MSQLNQNRSAEIFAQSRRRIPGGVNSPVRAFQAVDRVRWWLSPPMGRISLTRTAIPISTISAPGDR